MQQTKQNGHCQNLNILLSTPLYMDSPQFVYSSAGVHLSSFQDFAFINKAAVSLCVSLWKIMQQFLRILSMDLTIQPINFIGIYSRTMKRHFQSSSYHFTFLPQCMRVLYETFSLTLCFILFKVTMLEGVQFLQETSALKI